jgi:hypothetical protein
LLGWAASLKGGTSTDIVTIYTSGINLQEATMPLNSEAQV